jgi:YjbE family integral membrane protein
MLTDPTFWAALLQIIFINILLSGDNAIVIALAARTLPERERKWAVFGGTAGAVLLRILFTIIIVYLMQIPFLKLIGGILLLWIAVKLLIPEAEDGHGDSKAATTLWGAIGTIVVADAVMSLDNVIGVAAVAKDNMVLLVLGLIISIPLVVVGSTMMIKLLARFPILVTFGGALLGWIGGDVAVTDTWVAPYIEDMPPQIHHIVSGACAVLVVVVGLAIRRFQSSRRHVHQAAD